MIANHGKLEAFLHKSSHNACLNLEQRNHERILANTSIVAEIMLLDDLKPFHSLKALVVDGSFSGCSVVVVTDQAINLGQECLLYIEELGQMTTKVIWSERLGVNLLRIGFVYQT